MRALLPLLILVALAGCSRRERANPFDPNNPGTHGHPAGFVALAGDQTVTLRWDSATAPDLVGYQLYRALAGDTGFVPISVVLPPSTTTLHDFGLLNGADHHYRLYFVFQSGRGSLPAEDVATPGPIIPWVTDYQAGTLARLTADGRHVAEVLTPVAGGTPSLIDVDMQIGAIWVCDPTSGAVSFYRPSLQSLTVYRNGFQTPRSVVVDSVDHTAWVGDEGFDLVQHVTALGTPAGPNVFADAPLGVALEPVTRALWICERAGNRVHVVDGSGGWVTGMTAPTHVAVDSVTRFGWVSSFSTDKVLVLSATGARIDSIGGFDGPIGIAVDSRRGRVWVCDPNVNQVLAFRRNRTLEFRITGLAGAHEIAVDPESGEAWVTLGLGGAVARLSPTGSVIRMLGGFAEPFGIALDIPGRRGGSGPSPASLHAPAPATLRGPAPATRRGAAPAAIRDL